MEIEQESKTCNAPTKQAKFLMFKTKQIRFKNSSLKISLKTDNTIENI